MYSNLHFVDTHNFELRGELPRARGGIFKKRQKRESLRATDHNFNNRHTTCVGVAMVR